MAVRSDSTRRDAVVSANRPSRRSFTSFTAPQNHGRRTTLTVAVLLILAAASVAVGVAWDLRLPTAHEWRITAVLAAVAIAGIAIAHHFEPTLDGSGPPWDVHTIWLLPAAMLTPPAAFGILVALSVVVDLRKSEHQKQLRMVVASITVMTTVAVHLASQHIADFALAGVVGIAALWLIGCIVAFAVAYVFVTPNGTALWLDIRWSLVVLACALSGLLIAAAMRDETLLGLTAIAPLLLAQFALRWPELTRYARIDSKTGLPNFQHWDERSRRLLAAAELRGTDAALLIIDLDRFKTVNDTHGHLAGDQVLTEVANLLVSQIAPGDLLGRFGGEEFVITLFDCAPGDALAAAERIRGAVARQEHRLAHSTQWDRLSRTADAQRPSAAGRIDRTDPVDPFDTERTGAPTCTVTCSIGIATTLATGYDVTALLEAADESLGDAKSAGRDAVRSAASREYDEGSAAMRQDATTLWDLAAGTSRRAAGAAEARRSAR